MKHTEGGEGIGYCCWKRSLAPLALFESQGRALPRVVAASVTFVPFVAGAVAVAVKFAAFALFAAIIAVRSRRA